MKKQFVTQTRVLCAALATAAALALVPSAEAQIYYWDGNGTTAGAGTAPSGTWGSSAFWSTSSAGTLTTANTTTTSLNQLRFSAGTDATGSYTVTVSGTQTARQLSLEYGNITFSGGSINLRSTGNAGASNVVNGIVLASTVGSATISSNLTIDNVQIFNVATGKTLRLDTGTFTRNAGASLNVLSTGTVTSSMTGLSSLTNGILGPWATYDSSSSMRYATVSGSTIAGLTGTSAATAANVTDTTGTLNYDVAAVGALGAGASVNTLRYTGAAGTITGDLTANGLMNAGSGAATLSGNVTIGSTRELVVTPASNNFTLSGRLQDNSGGASSLLVTQPAASNSLGLALTGSNSYSGGTTISNARVSISNANALGTGTVTVLKGGNGSFGDFGGQLELSGGFALSNNMTLAGQGYGGFSGALRSSSGTNTLAGTITAADPSTRIASAAGTLILGGTINLTNAVSYSNMFQHAGGDIRLSGTIAGAAELFGVIGITSGTNFFITDRANAWGSTLGLQLGVTGQATYGRVDLNGYDQSLNYVFAQGTVNTGNLITNLNSGTTATLTFTNNSSRTSDNTFAGNLALTKTGAGTHTLTAANTYTGATTVSAGSLVLSGSGTLGTSAITVSGGALDMGAKSLTNTLTVLSSGTLANGTLTNNGSNYDLRSGAVSASLAGTNGVSKTTSGTVTLSGSNSYTGATTVSGSGSVLAISNANALGATSGTTTVGQNAQLQLSNNISVAESITLNGFGPGGQHDLANGALRNISGNNTVTGAITLGTEFSQNWIRSEAGTLNLTGGVTSPNRDLTLTGGGTLNVTTNAINLGTGTLSVFGQGTPAVSIGVGNNTAGQVTVWYGGKLRTDVANAFSSSTGLSMGSGDNSPGSLDLNGNSQTFGNLSSQGTGSVVITSASAATLSVNQTVNNTYLGTITGAVALTKSGSSTLTLSGSNTYTGATTVSAGILALGAADRLSNSTAVTVNGGGLNMASFNDTVASLAITSGSVFGAGTLTAATYGLGGGTVAANLGGGTLNVTGNSTLSGAAAATAVNLNAGTLTLGSGGRLTGNAAVSGSAGAALALGGNETIASLAGAANVSLGSSLLTVGDATSTTYSGVLSGAGGSLTKTGAGRLLLAGANLYSGATTIAGGTLALDAGGSFANSSSIIVGNAGSSGAVLDLTAKTGSFDIGAGQTLGGGGTVQLAAAGTLNVLGLLSPGNSPGLLTFDAGTTLLSGTTLMEISGLTRATDPSHGTGFYDAINVIDSGVLTFGGLLQLAFSQEFADDSTFDLFSSLSGGSLAGNFTGVSVTGSYYTGLTWSQSGTKWTSTATAGGQTLEFNATSGQLVIVPEPGAIVLAGVGIAAAAWALRRRTA